jgi:hypothetical protein
MPTTNAPMIVSFTNISNFLCQVTAILKEAGVHTVMVQVEKESYFFHMSGLGSSMDNTLPISYTPSKVRFTSATSVI